MYSKPFSILYILVIGFFFSCTDNIRPLQDNWEKAIPLQEVPSGLVSIRARDCGVCHREIYDEWRQSTHAHAWTDLQFQAELKKESSPYLCINCHIPLENQQEFLIKGLVDGDIYKPVREENAHFDADFQLEGISCATCHVRDGSIIGLHETKAAPHPVVKDSLFLNESICLSCHNASAVVTPELVCTFETGDEWMNGPYAGSKNCISCHMDTISRPLMQGMQSRVGHRHWFAGSGIPKSTEHEVKNLMGMAYFPDTLPKIYQGEDSLIFNLKLVNQHAGHRLPTGDPERFYSISLAWFDSSGDTISHVTDRIGETWEWYPVARKITDNNLEPGEERNFQIRLSPSLPGQYRLSVKVTKHRMDKETADYNGLTSAYPILIKEFEFDQVVDIR